MAATNREKWRKSVKAMLPHRHEETGTGTGNMEINSAWVYPFQSGYIHPVPVQGKIGGWGMG